MNLARRDVVRGCGGLVAAAVVGLEFGQSSRSALIGLPVIKSGTHVMFLNDGSTAAHDFYDRLRAGRPGTITSQSVALLRRDGFERALRVIDASRGVQLIALLGNAEALVLDALLHARRPRNIVRQPVGSNAVVFSAMI